MNIVILANNDIASNFALNLLLQKLNHHKINVFLSSKVGKNNDKHKHLKSLAFFEQTLFNELLSPLIDNKPVNDQDKIAFRSFKQLAALTSTPFKILNNINSEEGFNDIAQCQPELIVSIRYGVILKERVLSLAKHGVINLHSGLLPDYRGVMATFWTMLNDENLVGTTLHYIDDNTIDTGRVLATSTMEIEPEHSYLWHVLQLYINGSKLIEDTINKLAQGITPEALPQKSQGNYYTFPTESDLIVFKNKGYTLVDESEILAFYQNYYL